MNIQQLLASLKGNNFNAQNYHKLTKIATQSKVQIANLWKLKPELKLLFSAAKIQSFLLLFAGLTILPYTLYQKYQEDNKKLVKLVIFAPFAFGVCFFPAYYYRKFSRTLLQQINFNIKTQKIQVIQFKTKRILSFDPSSIKFAQTDKKRIKIICLPQLTQTSQKLKQQQQKDLNETKQQLNIYRHHQIQGLGQWESIQLFKYLVKNQI